LGVLGLAAVALEAIADQPLHLLSKHYRQKNLVSDGALPVKHTDEHLVNPWGIAFNPSGFVWVADNRTGVATLWS
jgi:hypothetical protein